MIIRCWGSRGSISVSGEQYVSYGGDTTCVEVVSKTGEIVIIDAGTGIRNLGNSLLKRGEKKYFILLSHCHWDHIQGISFFKPLLDKDVELVVQDRNIAEVSTRDIFKTVMTPPFFPIHWEDMTAKIRFDARLARQNFSIGSLSIESIPTSHSQGTLGYKFSEDGKSFVFLTDNELGFDHPQGKGKEGYARFAENADLLFHDAEYTKEEYLHRRGWGHSSIDDVLWLAQKAKVKTLGLIHLNQDRCDDEMDRIVDACNQELRAKKCPTRCLAVSNTSEFTL